MNAETRAAQKPEMTDTPNLTCRTRTPASSAARSLPPIAYTCRPNGVRVAANAPIAASPTISQIGSTDQWQIHSGLDAHNETITFSNHAALHAGDFVFV